jgi:hypothetical protein
MVVSAVERARRGAKEALVEMSSTVRDLASYGAYARVVGEGKLFTAEQQKMAKIAFGTQMELAFGKDATAGRPSGVYRACAFRRGDAILGQLVRHLFAQ